MKEEFNLSSNLEDYLEAISILSKDKPHVHLIDVAKMLNVKKPSVTNALNILAEKGLVIYEKYKPVNLTKEGILLSEKIKKKHFAFKEFFIDYLDLEEAQANDIACKMEHIFDEEVFDKFQKFLNCLNSNNSNKNKSK